MVISEEEVIEYLRSAKQNELSGLINRVKEEFNLQEVLAPAAAQTEEQKKDEASGNVSLKVLEVGKELIKVYGKVKDIVNGATGGQITIINAKQTIDQKKPILESIPRAKAEEYKKQLEELGAVLELAEVK